MDQAPGRIGIRLHGWHLPSMATPRKVTVELPADLLEKAQRSSGHNLTETICQGLKLVAASAAYDGLRRRRGKVRFSIDLRRLRDDRR